MPPRHGGTPVSPVACTGLAPVPGPTAWSTLSGYSAPGDPALGQSRTTTSTEARTLTQNFGLQEFDGDDDWA